MIKYLFLFSFAVTKAGAQILSPITVNSGGGFTHNFEWSIAESASIVHFNANNISLNTGLLQPYDNISKLIETIDKDPFFSSIKLWPNPTEKLLNIKIDYTEVGNFSFQIMDVIGNVVLTHDVGVVYSNYEKSVSIEKLPSAPYFLKINFKPINQIAKSKVYKIIKL